MRQGLRDLRSCNGRLNTIFHSIASHQYCLPSAVLPFTGKVENSKDGTGKNELGRDGTVQWLRMCKAVATVVEAARPMAQSDSVIALVFAYSTEPDYVDVSPFSASVVVQRA